MLARLRELLEIAGDVARRNLGLKLLALAAAVGLWWFVTGERNSQVAFAVPLGIRNVPPGMTISNRLTDRVEVRLAGPAALIAGLRERDVTAEIELAGRGEGRWTLYLSEGTVRVPAGVRVQRIDPIAVDVVLARLERRSVPVGVRLGGSPQARRRIAKIVVDPPRVDVEALPEEFSRMTSVWTEEVVPEPAEGVYSARARVELTEKHARIVGNPTVRVTVTFR